MYPPPYSHGLGHRSEISGQLGDEVLPIEATGGGRGVADEGVEIRFEEERNADGGTHRPHLILKQRKLRINHLMVTKCNRSEKKGT